jgi:uncharacterized protein (TIGR02186 family)
MKKYLLTFFLLVWGTLWCHVLPGWSAETTMDLLPELVQIGTFYNGTAVTVSGEVPAGSEVVVRLSGEAEDLHLKKKGKIGGLLWMNTGDLTFHNAPRVYKLYTSKALSDLDNSPAGEFGFTALINRIEISPAAEDKGFLANEFVRLKKKDKLYSHEGDTVSFGAPEGGMKTFQASLNIPPAMKQGTYTVEVAAVQDGRILATASKPLELKQVSFPAQLTELAFGHSLWFGIMAVVIAVLAGLLTGVMFKDKGGAH